MTISWFDEQRKRYQVQALEYTDRDWVAIPGSYSSAADAQVALESLRWLAVRFPGGSAVEFRIEEVILPEAS